jgi:hypothetical protein
MLKMIFLFCVLMLSLGFAWKSPSNPTTSNAAFRHRVNRDITIGSAAFLSLLLPNQIAYAEVLKEMIERSDVPFPVSMEGDWDVITKITLVEGDVNAAEAAWRGLGGTGDFKSLTERFKTRLIKEGENGRNTVVDRAYEMQSRIGTTGRVQESSSSNQIKYVRVESGDVKKEFSLRVWQRSIEQLDNGFGFKELVTINENGFERVAQVKRRYKPESVSGGGRISAWDGLEIVKTFRLLDGVIGDLPTSTIKSRIRMERAPTAI